MLKQPTFKIPTRQEAEARITELTKLLHHYNEQYYQQAISEITDEAFDWLLLELQDLEKKHPDLLSPTSPTQRVGGTITKDFKTVKHRYSMLSLANTYSEQELREFDERVKKLLGGQQVEYVCEQKFDGLALSLTYRDGKLVQAVTRGDGTQGDDVTANARTLRGIPLAIRPELGYPKEFEIRGEVYMPYEVFEKLNEQRIACGEAPLANPRNAAAGAMKQQDSREVAKRGLHFFGYTLLGENLPYDTHSASMQAMQHFGFPISPTWEIHFSIEGVMDYIKKWETKRSTLPLATDGVVVKVNAYHQQKELGFNSKTPRWAIAYKYPAEVAKTLLRSITYQVGRTGTVTPVANLSPVSLGGTTVKRASIHNANQIALLDLRVGDTVLLEKGGEIIPKITGMVKELRPQDSQPVQFPTECPSCGTQLVRPEGEAHFRCPNATGCGPQLQGRLEHFVSRKAMNIEGLGEGKLAVLIEHGLVKNIADLYDLKYEQLVGLEREIEDPETGNIKRISFRERTAEIIVNAIEQSKQMPFERVLFALGIRQVGEGGAKRLVKALGSMRKILEATREELAGIPDVGGITADAIIQWREDPNNQNILERLKEAGLCFEAVEVPEVTPLGSSLAGKTFLLSGVFSQPREDLHTLIELNGGTLSSGISKKLSYLVAGDKMGPAKREKALKEKVMIISEEELFQLITG